MDLPIKKKLPIYNLVINEDDNDKTLVNYISLVETPAIEVDYVVFSDNKDKKFRFKIQDSEKRCLAGPLMIPNLPIYRVNQDTKEEYYVVMSEETIENAVKKFSKNQLGTNINANHNTDIDGAFLMEHWIISDPKNDKSNTFKFSNLPKGTWFGIVHLDEPTWDKYIKSGDLKLGGFSVEGMFNMGDIIGEKGYEMKKQNEEIEFLELIAKLLDESTFQ